MKDYEVTDPEFNSVIQITETTDTNHADNINHAPIQNYSSIMFLKHFLDENPNFRLDVKDITNLYSNDDLHEMVAAGDFSKLAVGNYFTRTITTSLGGTEDVDCMIGGFDYFYGACNPECTDHHLILVTKDEFTEAAQMNDSNTTEGGFVGSAMFTDVLPIYSDALDTALGGHLLKHYRYLTNTVNTSAPSAGGTNFTGSTTAAAWTEVGACLMSEAMLYGGSAFSSGGRDISDACIQLPIFAMRPDFRVAGAGKGGSRRAFWLCGVASSTTFCHASGDGRASYANASASYGVRPYFLFS